MTTPPRSQDEWMRWVEQRLRGLDTRIASGPASANTAPGTIVAVPAASGSWTSATQLIRRGDSVELLIDITAGASGTGAGVTAAVIPAAHRPVNFGLGGRYFFAVDSGTAAQVAFRVEPTTGALVHTFARTPGQRTLGHLTYIAV